MENVNVEKETKIGMIYSCNDWHTCCGHEKHCGLLIGIYGTKLYYFEKAEKINLKRFELVRFIEDEEKPDVAKRVSPLVQNEIESEEKSRFDTISWAKKQAIKLFNESKEYNNASEPTDWELKTEIDRLQKYIDELDSISVINTFVVKQTGHYVRRVGRDDHFHYSTTRRVDSNDLYINHLLETGENSGYECTNSYEEDYDYIDKMAIQSGIQKALSKYNKNSHLAFLLNNYIKERYEQLFKKVEIKHKLEGLFNYDMVGAALGNHRYIDDFEYEEVTKEYNAKSMKG